MWSNWSIKKNTQNTRTQRSLSIFVNVSRIPAATFRGVGGVGWFGVGVGEWGEVRTEGDLLGSFIGIRQFQF